MVTFTSQFKSLCAGLLLGVGIIAMPTSTAAKTSGNEGDVILILDASGSMWAKAGAESRIDAARKTVSTVMAKVPQGRSVGLMAYGHRNAGDCRDIELIVPAAAGQSDRVIKAANAIVPKGKTPLSAAVKMAAESLRYKDAPATVVLVTDGVETCKADPCALAAELEKSGVNFTAHVIGFGLTADQGQQVACLAHGTGGQYITAANAQELGKALSETIVEAPQPAPPVKAAPPAKPVAIIETGLKLKAVLKDGGEVYPGPGYVWRVQSPVPNIRGEHETIATKSATTPFFELEPGPYRVEVLVGPVRRSVIAEVRSDAPTELTVVLDAGMLRLRALASEGGEQLSGLVWRVNEAKADLAGNRRELAATSSDKPNWVLPAGDYVVTAIYGKAKTEVPVTIAAEVVTEKDVVMGAGVLSVVSTVGAEPVSNTMPFVLYVMGEPKGLEAQREQLEATSNPNRQFKLGAGTYLVRGRLGNANAWAEIPAVVKANERTEIKLNFEAGIAVPRPIGADGQPLAEQPFWTFTAADGTHVGRASGARASIWLKPGSYKVSAIIKRQNVEASFDIKAGQRIDVDVKVP